MLELRHGMLELACARGGLASLSSPTIVSLPCVAA